MEGKFLERRQYKNADRPGEIVTPTDLGIGGDVKINGYSFRILSCDEFTQNYLNTHTYWTASKQTTTTSTLFRSMSTIIALSNLYSYLTLLYYKLWF